MINVQINELTTKIDELSAKLESKEKTVEDYKIQTIDPNINCDTTLEVIKALPKFNGEQTQYVGWREAAETAMSLYKIKSKQ